MEEEKYWIWLSRMNGLGSIRKNKLLQIYKTPKNIWNLKFEDIVKLDGFGNKIAEEILEEKYRKNLDKYIEYMEKNNIKMINIYDKEYPKKLKSIYDPPVTLYVKGNIEILKNVSIAIIGCRNCSTYGKQVSTKFAYDLAKENITIISGLAKGIDSYAHVRLFECKRKHCSGIRKRT